MLFLLDTNVISDLMRDYPSVTANFSRCTRTDQVIICPITKGEVLYGISRLPVGVKRTQLEARAEGLLASIPCQPLSDAVADEYARIRREVELVGTPIADNDLWIAATAVQLKATLITRDSAFRHVTSLVTQDWSI